MRKQWIYTIQVVLSLAMVCILAISCTAPSSTEQTISPPTPQPIPENPESSWIFEPYWVSTAGQEGGWITLKTIGSWRGSWQSGEYNIPIKINKTPWTVNAGYTNTPDILGNEMFCSFQVFVQSEKAFTEGSPLAYALNQHDTIFEITFEGTGDYVIRVFAFGCTWWVKVGVE